MVHFVRGLDVEPGPLDVTRDRERKVGAVLDVVMNVSPTIARKSMAFREASR